MSDQSRRKGGRGMKFIYDRTADSILVWLAEEKVAETKEIGPGVYAEYDADGRGDSGGGAEGE